MAMRDFAGFLLRHISDQGSSPTPSLSTGPPPIVDTSQQTGGLSAGGPLSGGTYPIVAQPPPSPPSSPDMMDAPERGGYFGGTPIPTSGTPAPTMPANPLSGILDTILGKTAAPAPATPGQPPFLDTSGGGGHDLRNLIIAGAIRALGPAIFGKRTRNAWGGLTAPIMGQTLGNLLGGRDDQLAAQRQALVTAGINSGQYSITPPTTGAPPIGNFAGIPLYKQSTVSEKFPNIFQSQTDLPKETTWTPGQPPGQPPHEPGFTPPFPIAPTNAPSAATQVYGGLPASPAGIAGAAKLLADQEALKRKAAGDAAMAALIGGAPGVSGQTGVGTGIERTITAAPGVGGIKWGVSFKPSKPPSVSQQIWDRLSLEQQNEKAANWVKGQQHPEKLSQIQREERMQNQNLEDQHKSAMSPAQTLEFDTARKSSPLIPLIATEATRPYQAGIERAVKILDNTVGAVPPAYSKLVLDPSDKWEKAVANPAVKAEIDAAGATNADFAVAHKGQSLTDFISEQRQTWQSNETARQNAWQSVTGKGGVPGPSFTAPAGQTPAQMNDDLMRQQLFGGR